MFDDDVTPKAQWKPMILESLSITELESYIVDLKNEITRVEDNIAQKKIQNMAADKLFSGQ